MLLTEYHKKLNLETQNLAVKSFGQRRRTVAEAMAQYARIKRQSSRHEARRTEAAPTPGGPRVIPPEFVNNLPPP